MSLRERHTELTRTAILDAAADALFTRSDPTTLTMQDIADAAGVSHRTLYRHFDSRRELAQAVGRHVEVRLQQGSGASGGFPTSTEEYVANADRSLVLAATNAQEMRRMLVASLTLGEWRTDRDEEHWKVFRREFPHLEEREARADFAVLRLVLGASAWFFAGEQHEIDLESLSPAVRRAARALVESIATRDQEAAKGDDSVQDI